MSMKDRDSLLRQCIASGQVGADQIEAHRISGELHLTESDVGVEAALPIQFADRPSRPERWAPYLGVAISLIGAIAAYVYVVVGQIGGA